ncbi:hypothetical protein DXG01_010420 [Tephrocybe rancida]|nr:hypothetical protein DXG01_010420 [Tephrocybe rancida]
MGPLCVLAARVVAENENIIVTILTTRDLYEKSRFEIARQFESSSSSPQRIRLVSIVDPATPDLMTAAGLFAQSYTAAYEALSGGKAITCLKTGTSFEAIVAPAAIIMDFFCLAELKATRALTGDSVPIISWVTGGSPTLLRCWGPESMGGFGDLSAIIQAEVERTGRPLFEVGNEVYKPTGGAVVRIPGVPAMYDYEFRPQKLPFDMPLVLLLNAGREFLKASDAMLIASSEAYEKDSLDAVKAWQSEGQKLVHVVGPLLSFSSLSAQSDINEENSYVAGFLDNALEKHGKHSAVFISFGTTFWPTIPEYIDEVVDALIEKKYPFILSHASPFARVSLELSDKIKTSGLGLSTPWSPQQFILNHPATGWFLTHGGHGGITEICWPFDADQPAAAAHITDNLKAAFELHEVKTDLGLKTLHRTGQAVKGTREAVGGEIRLVLEACRVEEGAELRRNAQMLSKQFRAAWEEDGAATIALRTAHVTENLKAAFELHEVKTIFQQRILHRTEKVVQGTPEAVGGEIRRVLDACRGEEGTELRRSAEKLKKKFRGAWNEDGPSKVVLKEFLHT